MTAYKAVGEAIQDFFEDGYPISQWLRAKILFYHSDLLRQAAAPYSFASHDMCVCL